MSINTIEKIKKSFCFTCNKPIDSSSSVDLCTCAFELDMEGVL